MKDLLPETGTDIYNHWYTKEPLGREPAVERVNVVELEVPDNRMGHLLEYRESLPAGQSQPVEYVLATSSEVTRAGAQILRGLQVGSVELGSNWAT